MKPIPLRPFWKIKQKWSKKRGSHWSGIQFNLVQLSPLTDWFIGDVRDNSAEILFQSFLLEALVSRYGMSRYVHSLMLSIQHFLRQPWHHPPSKMPWRMVLERLSWHVNAQTMPVSVSWQSPASFLWTHKEVDLTPHRVVGLVLQVGDMEKFPHALGLGSLDPFLASASRVHVSQSQRRMEVTRDLYRVSFTWKYSRERLQKRGSEEGWSFVRSFCCISV